MAVFYAYICDGCGKTGGGVPGNYVHPDPPMGWTWRFGPGLDGPHACSEECWQTVCRTEDGRHILPDSHERGEWRTRLAKGTVASYNLSSPPVPPPAPVSVPKSWVYFAQRKDNGHIKIGVSGNVKARISALQTALSEPLTLLVSTPGTRATERELHAQFHAHRLSGEWFKPAPELLAHIAGLNEAKEQVR